MATKGERLRGRKTKTTFVIEKEGGLWVPFDEFKGGTVHAVKFADHSVWDCVNGWRERANRCRDSKNMEALIMHRRPRRYGANDADEWLLNART